jgi:DNA-binding NarL/FixJ family response regulator
MAATPATIPRVTTRVLLVDDHDLVVEALRRLIEDQPDINVLATVGSGAAAIDAAIEDPPDVVVVDYGLPDMSGARVAARLRECVPAVRVLMLTGSGDPAALRAAFAAGCVGFLEKNVDPHRLTAAIRAAAAGDTFFSADDLRRLRTLPAAEYGALSRREVDVLGLMAAGESNQRIAGRLHISLNTVRSHTQSILEKLGAHSRLEAVALARRAGLLSGDGQTSS